MPSRKPRLSRIQKQRVKNSRTGRPSQGVPKPGQFNRAYFEGPDPTLRGQVRGSDPFMEMYHSHLFPVRVALAQKNGLTPKKYLALVADIAAEANRHHSMPLDTNGEPLLRTNSKTREVDITGVKRLRGRPSYFHSVKQLGSEIHRVRAAMKWLVKKYPGIDILRQLEDRRESLSDSQILAMAKSPIFKLDKVTKHKLLDEFVQLELSEHRLINQILAVTADTRAETASARKSRKK